MLDDATPSATGYNPVGPDLAACLICGCLVGFTYMVIHTAWHNSLAQTIVVANQELDDDTE